MPTYANKMEGTRRLVTSHGFQAVCRHKRAQFKLPNRQIAKQVGSGEPLGGATATQGANKEPPLTPAAFVGRRKGGKIGLRQIVSPFGCVREVDFLFRLYAQHAV
jgi:hypothetical protein